MGRGDEAAVFVVAVDPGLMTGLAHLTWDPGDRRVTGGPYAQETPYANALDWCWRNADDKTHIVCESYIIGPETIKKSRGENWSLESIGALRFIARHKGATFSTQSPGQAKRVATDHMLKQLGWYGLTSSGHGRDALRHLMVWALSNQDKDLARRVAEAR